MGWDVTLMDNRGEVVKVPRHFGGSNIVAADRDGIPGNQDASMVVTYNYSPVLRAIYAEGFEKTFHGVLGCESEYELERGIRILGEGPFVRLANAHAEYVQRQSKNSKFGEVGGYWLPTAENVSQILGLMLLWARQHQQAKWEIIP